MAISRSERRSHPQSTLLRGPKREVFPLPATYPLFEVLHKPLYLITFTGRKSSQSQGKGHCQLLPKDWKTASHASTGDPRGPAATTGCYGLPFCMHPIPDSHAQMIKNLPASCSGCVPLFVNNNPKKSHRKSVKLEHWKTLTLLACVVSSPDR